MKTTTRIIAALAIAGAIVPSIVDAKPWRSINARQARIDARIDQGIRSGGLTRREAGQLRADYRALAAREARYRAGGLSAAERRDLDARFDALSAKVFVQRHDFQNRSR